MDEQPPSDQPAPKPSATVAERAAPMPFDAIYKALFNDPAADPNMALRFLEYGSELLRELRGSGALARGEPCPILCVAVHNGRRRWRAPIRSDEPVRLPAVLGAASGGRGLARAARGEVRNGTAATGGNHEARGSTAGRVATSSAERSPATSVVPFTVSPVEAPDTVIDSAASMSGSVADTLNVAVPVFLPASTVISKSSPPCSPCRTPPCRRSCRRSP